MPAPYSLVQPHTQRVPERQIASCPGNTDPLRLSTAAKGIPPSVESGGSFYRMTAVSS